MDDHLQCVKLILDHEAMLDIGSLHNLRAENLTSEALERLCFCVVSSWLFYLGR